MGMSFTSEQSSGIELCGQGLAGLTGTDFVMPEMSGEDLVAAIRANPELASLKVYLFTADVEKKKTYAEKGFNGILLKPVTLESLKGILQ